MAPAKNEALAEAVDEHERAAGAARVQVGAVLPHHADRLAGRHHHLLDEGVPLGAGDDLLDGLGPEDHAAGGIAFAPAPDHDDSRRRRC